MRDIEVRPLACAARVAITCTIIKFRIILDSLLPGMYSYKTEG
jgi:hypothetical protein